jgi:hypothetical protein
MRYAARSIATRNTLSSLTVASGGGMLDVQSNQTLSMDAGSSLVLTGNPVNCGTGRLAVSVAGTRLRSFSVTGDNLGVTLLSTRTAVEQQFHFLTNDGSTS